MEVLEGQEPVVRMGEVVPIPSLHGGTSKSASAHSGRCPGPCESPTFRKENHFFRFCSIKRKPRFADELCSVPAGLCHLEGWPSNTPYNLIINLAEEPLLLVEETLLGYYEREDEEDMIVDHEGLFEVNIEKPYEAGELEDKLFPPGGDGFITSPADVDPRPPIKLKDAEVSQEHRVAFEGLCEEFADVFITRLGGLGEDTANEDGDPDGRQPTHKSATIWSCPQTCTMGPRRK